MKRAQGCFELAREYLISMGIFILAFAAVVAFHEHASRWEPIAIIGGLLPGVTLTLLYFRTKRKRGWILGAVGGLCLTFSFGLALFHGWRAQAEVAVWVGVTVVLVGVAILIFRFNRHITRAMDVIHAATHDPAGLQGNALFRDDGERIVIFPNRRRVLVQCTLQALLLSGLAAALALPVTHHEPLVWGALGIFACVLMGVFLSELYRLLVNKPTLTVGPDGILDNGSLVATGRGLLRWDDIASVRPQTTSSSRFVTHRYLAIVVSNGREIRTRQPLWKRALMPLLGQGSPYQLTIWQGLLDVPADELATLITRYVRIHAPPGWIEKDEDDEDGEGEGGAIAEQPAQP